MVNPMQTGKHWQDIFQMVVKETDFVLEILDARNPLGTHNTAIERFIAQNRPEIQLFLVLNKADVVPKRISRAWKKYFQNKGYRVFIVSSRYRRGISELFSNLTTEITRPHSNILIVGYPNTGKSSLIEALTKGKKKAGVSAKAGFTRVIQKIKLTNKIYLLDTPGIIPIAETDETDMAIKACMTADKLDDPLAVVEAIFQLLLHRREFERVYDISLSADDGPPEVIQKIGRKRGKLVKGGLVNEPEVQKLIIRDWQSNKLRYYSEPPSMKKNNHSKSKKDTQNDSQSDSHFPKSLRS